MAKVNHKRARLSKVITKFSGLGSSDPHLNDGAEAMLNLRLTEEGTLQKREGVRRITYFPNMLRAYWEGTFSNVAYTFCVIGNKLYRVEGSEMTLTDFYILNTSEGPAEFYEMNGYLYLLDGSSITVFNPDNYSFYGLEPYAPLIGENWHPTSMGASNEQPNLLTPHMRVHYKNTIGATTFYIPYYAKTIDRVLVGSEQAYDYTFKANTNYVNIPSAANAVDITIAFTAPFNEAQRTSMLAAQRAFVFKDKELGSQRMLLYRTSEPYKLYLSSEVTSFMLNYCDLFYPYCAPLYFTSANVLFVGDSQDSVTTVCPYFDTALIFTQNTTRLFRLEDGVPDADMLLPYVGCTPIGGAMSCDGAIVTVSKNGVFRLTARPSAPDEITVERVSDHVLDRLRNYIGTDSIVFWNPRHREVWICTPQEEYGTVWVWSASHNAWYNFDDLPATRFISSPSRGICYVDGNVFYVFDEFRYNDDGNSYSVIYTSKYLDLGDPDRVRHALHWSLNARITGSTNMAVYTSRGATQNTILPQYINSLPEHYEGRIYANRHRFLRFSISMHGSGRAAIYRVAFFAKD